MLLKDIYKFNRLIFVNSANHAYTELPIDRHTLLVGPNNIGKTSSLSALKLFLLPEVNFKDSPAKFQFKSNNTAYDSLDSFQYYFPCNQSFIVLDGENPHGPFCVVLGRGSGELTYARTFVPQPYEAIQHLFWEHAEQGIGKPKVSLSREGIKTALKGQSPVYASDVDTIKTTIYQENALDPRLGRFCMVPLPDGGSRQEVEALRSLVQMLFDSSDAKGQSLPRAIATIIEGERQTSGERLAVDFDSIIGEHATLYADRKRLDRLEDNLPLWQQLDEASRGYADLRTKTVNLYAEIRRGAEEVEAALRPQYEEWDRARQRLHMEHDDLTEQRTEASATYNQQLGMQKSLRKTVEKLQQDVKEAERVFKEYPSTMDATAIIDALKSQQEEHKTNIVAANDHQEAQRKLEGYLEERRDIFGRLSRAQSLLEAGNKTALGQLSAQSASVLKSLNKELASSRAPLTSEQLAIAESFASQFAQVNGHLAWCDDMLPNTSYLEYDPALEQERLNREIGDLTTSLSKVESDIAAVKGILQQTTSQKANYLDEQELALLRATRDEQLVLFYTHKRAELDEKQKEMAQQEEIIDKAKGGLDNMRRQQEEVSLKLDEAKAMTADITSRRSDIGRLIDSARNVMFADTEGLPSEPVPKPPIPEAGLAAAVDRYHTMYADLTSLRAKAIASLRQLIRHQLIQDISEAEADRDDIGFDDVLRYRERFSAEFLNIAGLKENHQNRVFEHNKSTNNMVAELRANANRIRSFEAEINAELGAHHVSNLTKINIKIDLDPRFVDLQGKIEKRQASVSETELASADFYMELDAFAKEFFRKRGQQTILNLHDVISQVQFVYGREQAVVRKNQSTGTTSMFFAILLSTLFERLIAGGNQLQMPLVMDEVANLDADNLKTLIEVAQRHGFSLFSATPELSGLLASVIGNWIALGRLQVTNPLAPECTCIWIDGHEELHPLEGVA